MSAIAAAGPMDGAPPDDEAATPKPAGRRALLQAALAAFAALLIVAGAGLVVLPSVLGGPTAAVTPPVREELRAWRVSDHNTAAQLDGLLQSGWRIERADTDSWGTTYVVRRPLPVTGDAAAP